MLSEYEKKIWGGGGSLKLEVETKNIGVRY